MTPEDKQREAEAIAACIVQTWREGSCACHSDDERLELLITVAITGIFTQAERAIAAACRHRWPDR